MAHAIVGPDEEDSGPEEEEAKPRGIPGGLKKKKAQRAGENEKEGPDLLRIRGGAKKHFSQCLRKCRYAFLELSAAILQSYT